MKLISKEAQRKIEEEIQALKLENQSLLEQSQVLEEQKKALLEEARLLKTQSEFLHDESEKQKSDFHEQIKHLQQGLADEQEKGKQLQTKLAEIDSLLLKTQQDRDQIKKSHEELTQQKNSLDNNHQQLKKDLEVAQASLQSALNEQKKISELTAAKTSLEEQVGKLKAELDKNVSELKKSKDELGKLPSLQKHIEELNSKIALAEKKNLDLLQEKSQITERFHQVNQSLDEYKNQISEHQAAQEDLSQENELLLLQLMQAQEELVEYYEEKGRFEKLYEVYKARWDRLELRYPSYIDFGAIELLSFDHLSDIPSLNWRIKDYAQGGVALPEFMFQIALQDGTPGIALVSDVQAKAEIHSTFIPQLIQVPVQAERFLAMGATEYRQLTAALTILAQLEKNQWQGIEIPAGLDLGFWKTSFKQLIAQWQELPLALRYDGIKLKRELINPDYEHLWLELQGVTYANKVWRKLEVRLGAALIQQESFSQYPKFEFPLIDGKHKPFDSWFAESHDDAGPKYELRFALDKNVFDLTTLSKLSDLDRALVLRAVYGMPVALRKLEDQQAPIHRSWSVWRDFASSAVRVLESNIKAVANLQNQTNTSQKEKQTEKQKEKNSLSASVESTKNSQPGSAKSVNLAKSASGPKIISIGAQPARKISGTTKKKLVTVAQEKRSSTKLKVAAEKPKAESKATSKLGVSKIKKASSGLGAKKIVISEVSKVTKISRVDAKASAKTTRKVVRA